MCDTPKIIYIESKSGKKFKLVVPCGHCLSCQNSKRAQLVQRFKKEKETLHHVYFCTLTYSENNLPILYYKPSPYGFKEKMFRLFSKIKKLVSLGHNKVYGDFMLNKKHAIDFMNKFKQTYKDKYNFNIKYYLCGEYGTINYRPHFHFVFFTKFEHDYNYINDLILQHWKYGNVSSFKCSDAGFNYIAKHCAKYDCGSPRQKKLAPIFQLQSTKNGGIGIELRNDEHIINNYLRDLKFGRIKDTKYRYALPRYVLKYLHPQNFTDEELKELETKGLQMLKDKMSSIGYAPTLDDYPECTEVFRDYIRNQLYRDFNQKLTKNKTRINKKYINYRRKINDNNSTEIN